MDSIYMLRKLVGNTKPIGNATSRAVIPQSDACGWHKFELRCQQLTMFIILTEVWGVRVPLRFLYGLWCKYRPRIDVVLKAMGVVVSLVLRCGEWETGR